MPRNLEAEIDTLRAEMQNLAQTVRELQWPIRPASDKPDDKPSGGPTGLGLQLQRTVEEKGGTGLITYAGYYQAGEQGYRWETAGRKVETLLDQDDDKVARALAALANKQRLALLKAILTQPASAAELVERLGMGTTGQVYHHLKALQAADLVVQEERGQYAFRGHRVQSLLMLLAGVYDLLDTRHSAGTWDEPAEA